MAAHNAFTILTSEVFFFVNLDGEKVLGIS
jgi:hypothetical protein